ncbi:hypothetical protein ODU73_001060 [Thermoclostridium stercorarium]|uniref:hypothetical protein n=1 Tax=Thermoclostridium stercorarium TaxID=1510 RepID=UPI0004AE1AC7|nr:hypothetical protein [Thermoclostridium stercorarium]UZQ86602.1 hypothetical protein ODU73_001060 [Thermoclostridium stercorarium]
MLLKKWWFYVIVAVVLIILAVPLSIIIRLNSSAYDDLSFTYVHYDDLLSEIAKKHLYYDASTRTVEIEINQDLINSLIKDQLEQTDLGLPDKLKIQEVVFKTADQRLYINAKYGSINLPVSAQINIEPTDMGITISASELNLGNKKAPKFITKRIPSELLTYTINFSDLGVPKIFTVKEIKYSTGNLNAFIQLDVDAIKELAKDYVDDLEVEINGFRRTASPFIATFIDRALAEGLLSADNVEKYVEDLLSNEELVNSAIKFAFAPNLDKYAKGIEKYRQAIVKWAEPIQTIKLDGTIDEIVLSIIENDKLHDMLTWFIPATTLSEYVDTASTYYTIYKRAEVSLNGLSAAIQSGDIERAIKLLIADRDLYRALTLVASRESVDYYLGSVKNYYNMYVDLTKSLTELLNSIPDEEITKYVNEAVKYAYEVENGQQYVLDILEDVDTDYIQELVYHLEKDEYIQEQLEMVDQESYDTFMAYVDDLDTIKADLTEAVRNADVEAVKEGADILKDINDDMVYVIELLRDKEYEKAGDAINKIRFDRAEEFIRKQSQKISASPS